MDFGPDRVAIDKAAFFKKDPMPRHRIIRFTAEILRAEGVEEMLWSQVEGLYSARRVLPTLADVSRYDPDERLDIGSWYHRM